MKETTALEPMRIMSRQRTASIQAWLADMHADPGATGNEQDQFQPILPGAFVLEPEQISSLQHPTRALALERRPSHQTHDGDEYLGFRVHADSDISSIGSGSLEAFNVFEVVSNEDDLHPIPEPILTTPNMKAFRFLESLPEEDGEMDTETNWSSGNTPAIKLGGKGECETSRVQSLGALHIDCELDPPPPYQAIAAPDTKQSTDTHVLGLGLNAYHKYQETLHASTIDKEATQPGDATSTPVALRPKRSGQDVAFSSNAIGLHTPPGATKPKPKPKPLISNTDRTNAGQSIVNGQANISKARRPKPTQFPKTSEGSQDKSLQLSPPTACSQVTKPTIQTPGTELLLSRPRPDKGSLKKVAFQGADVSPAGAVETKPSTKPNVGKRDAKPNATTKDNYDGSSHSGETSVSVTGTVNKMMKPVGKRNATKLAASPSSSLRTDEQSLSRQSDGIEPARKVGKQLKGCETDAVDDKLTATPQNGNLHPLLPEKESIALNDTSRPALSRSKTDNSSHEQPSRDKNALLADKTKPPPPKLKPRQGGNKNMDAAYLPHTSIASGPPLKPTRPKKKPIPPKATRRPELHTPEFDAVAFVENPWREVEAADSVATSVMSDRERKLVRGASTAWMDKQYKYLEYFCQQGKAAAVKDLLKAGCNPGAVRNRRPGPLINAINGRSHRHNKCVRELTDKLCDVNVLYRGTRPHHIAVESE
jgi:hypothetical protein